MHNPFEDLGKTPDSKPQGRDAEEVTGAFSCQHQGCYSVAKEAKYLRDVQILTWVCQEGHVSDIKDFRI